MTVRQLIELLQNIQDKDKFVYYYDNIKQESDSIKDIAQGVSVVYLTTHIKED